LNRVVVLRYRLYLESLLLAPNTINVRLAAIRRLSYEAADNGLLSPELVAGIRRVRGVKQLGYRAGNWLSPEQSTELLTKTPAESLRGKRDAAILALLLGCGLRRSELTGLELEQIQQRDQRWVIVDLVGSRASRSHLLKRPSAYICIGMDDGKKPCCLTCLRYASRCGASGPTRSLSRRLGSMRLFIYPV